uniref:Uncharacterized protein n=1 Tax=Anguilla anguilla TaxID=7936 RepID=A0A0E9TJJ3_ANGAN
MKCDTAADNFDSNTKVYAPINLSCGKERSIFLFYTMKCRA